MAINILGAMRHVSIMLALMGGEDPAVVMKMAKESAASEWPRSGTSTLDRGEQKQLELLSASELRSTVDDEEAVAVRE